MMRVLVVGAGPTGLTAALTLARLGARVELREQEPGLHGRSLAATLHPPTLAILAELGVDLTDTGFVADTIEYRRGAETVTFDLSELADVTDFPYRRHVPRLEVCRLLLAELRSVADVRFGEAAEPLSDAGYDLVVAADGPRSRWRQAAGIGFETWAYDGQVARLMCDPESFAGWTGVTYVFTETDSVSLLRLADHARVILRTGPEEPPLAELVARATAVLGTEPTVNDWSTYRSQRAVCETNLRGNVVLVGDAAHLTNTRGGMNMNAGIHDAAAIAQAAAQNPQRLLEVAAERLRVARDVLLPRTHAAVGSNRFDEVAAIHASPDRRREFLLASSMLDMVA